MSREFRGADVKDWAKQKDGAGSAPTDHRPLDRINLELEGSGPMHIVPAADSTATTPPESLLSSSPPCPVCGRPATSEVKRVRGGVTEANYCCGEHVWLTKWVNA